MVPPYTRNNPFCLSVCVRPPYPGLPAGYKVLRADSETLPDGPRLSQMTPRLYQLVQKPTRRPYQLTKKPSKLAPSPSLLALSPSQPALNSIQLALQPFVSPLKLVLSPIGPLPNHYKNNINSTIMKLVRQRELLTM